MKYLNKISLLLLSSTLKLVQAGTLQNTTGLETKENFMINAAKSFSERSGQIFAIPKKYNIVMGDYSLDGFSHFKKDGKDVKVKNLGTSHGSPWDYDTKIPIIMYGPGFINEGKTVYNFATQQDIPVTYANILNTEPPYDADGKVLSSALKKTKKLPKAILTVVLDQVGEAYYQAHPESFPEIKRLRKLGTYYANSKVTHLESETAVGHTAIGTGAYPENHGVSSNAFWLKGLGKENSAYSLDNVATPVWLKSPTLADVYDVKTKNKAIVVSYCYAERAAIGMAGHGSMYKSGDKDIVVFYDEKNDKLISNESYYTMPSYLKNMTAKPYLDKLTNGTGVWFDHKIPMKQKIKKVISKKEIIDNKVMATPIFPVFEGDLYTKIIEKEPIGQDDVTDLLYMTFKSTDLASHTFGFESEECKEILEAVDNQVGRVVRALEKKVGKDNIIVTITADHGSTPLVERTGGTRLLSDELKKDLNHKFGRLNNDVECFIDVGPAEITVDERELKRNGYTLNDVKKYLLNYTVKGKSFFEYVFTKEELLKLKYEKELKGN